ncbi:hypothetical protein JHW43_001196 [Diplocarpon mali]|nr:hypothetical protein JHW43_001196 [Diplocarpon mali]
MRTKSYCPVAVLTLSLKLALNTKHTFHPVDTWEIEMAMLKSVCKGSPEHMLEDDRWYTDRIIACHYRLRQKAAVSSDYSGTFNLVESEDTDKWFSSAKSRHSYDASPNIQIREGIRTFVDAILEPGLSRPMLVPDNRDAVLKSGSVYYGRHIPSSQFRGGKSGVVILGDWNDISAAEPSKRQHMKKILHSVNRATAHSRSLRQDRVRSLHEEDFTGVSQIGGSWHLHAAVHYNLLALKVEAACPSPALM